MFEDIFDSFDEIEEELKVEKNDTWDTGYEENIWRPNNMEDVWKTGE